MTLELVDEYLLAEQDAVLWELFHENSKTSRYERHPTFARRPSDAAIVAIMDRLRRVKPYTDYPKISLPMVIPATEQSLDEIMRRRQTARAFRDESIPLHELARVLFMGYGMTRDNQGTAFPRPFRTIPSGGALYPLELYVHASRIETLDPGLYHYDPEDHSLDRLRLGNDAAVVAQSFVQSDLALSAAAIIFVSAIFVRSTFKYGDRGYRFILIEAGHLAQNAILSAQELGLTVATIGGYMDREVDRYLGFDGVNESTIYIMLIGRP